MLEGVKGKPSGPARVVGNTRCWQSTFISFGTYLTDQGLKVAVLAVDLVLPARVGPY